MGKRNTARDPGGVKWLLSKAKWFWVLIQAIPFLRRWVNYLLLNNAIATIPSRPEPLCCGWNYTTWESLTNTRWSSRHLPPVPQDNLPDPHEIAVDLFQRSPQEFRPSSKSTLLFPYFAQWFVDGFLVGDPVDRRRNYSNHQIDLCQLYGLRNEISDLIRTKSGGRLLSIDIDGAEYPPFLYLKDTTTVDPRFCKRRSGYRGFADVGALPLFVEKGEFEVNGALIDAPLRYGIEMQGGALPRHLVFNEIPRQERVLDWEKNVNSAEAKTRLHQLFAIANDRGNATPAFTMMSTLFLREHNRVADKLHREYGWDDERTFQTTRNILIVILLRIVIEEYINHIAPYHFKLFVDPQSFFKSHDWKWKNWMTTEFQLLYRWHAMIPDRLQLGTETLPTVDALWNPNLVVKHGLANMFQYAADQTAGEIGPKNTWEYLVERTEVPSIQMGRQCQLASYNDYRALCGIPRVTSFDQISSNIAVQQSLQDHYGHVDRIEYFTGIFCEDIRDNSALSPVIGLMVAADAFSQALPNPLLQKRVWNKDTFSPLGWKIIHEETHTLDAVLKRNTPELSSTERDAISISMTRKDWAHR